MAETITARMRVSHVEQIAYDGKTQHIRVTAGAVYDADPASPNYSYSQATPWSELRMAISNPAAFDFFREGKEIDIAMTATKTE